MSTTDPTGDGGGDPPPPTPPDDSITPVTPSTGIAVSPGSHHQQHPPPSPLSGCYLLVVLPEPHTAQHRDLIINRLAKGFLSWDKDSCHVDLEKELLALVAQAPEGEEARNGERLIQYATENLVTEVLIHPQTNTLQQCMRNLLASFTKHRHIIHAGYTFSGNGSWILQDGTFSLADFLDAFSEHEVQRVLRAYENSVTVDINCAGVGEWSNLRLSKEACTRSCRVRLNPDDVLTAGVPAITSFTTYVGQYLVSQTLDQLMEPSDVVGNIRFSHPTLYVFPGGQGDAALFGINGFNMLVDGGFARKACFWDFARHLDRLDAVLMTRINNRNVGGMSSVLRKKREMHVYPQIGHFFCNLIERKNLNSPDGDKDLDPLILNLTDIGHEMMVDLRHINLRAHPCYRDPNPINLYHKVGHGTLDMYVLSPSKDSREVREFLNKWHASDSKLFSGSYRKDSNNLTFPIQNLASICALLVWIPANPEDTITRILFPGSTPQHKIFEGIERLKHLEFLKHPVCTPKSISPSTSLLALKDKPTTKQRLGLIEESKKSSEIKKEKRDLLDAKVSKAAEEHGIKPTPQSTPISQTPKVHPSKIDIKTKRVIDNRKVDTESKKFEKDSKEPKKESTKKDAPKIEKDSEMKKSETYKTKIDNEKTTAAKEAKSKQESKKKEMKELKQSKISKTEPPSKPATKISDKKQKPSVDKKDSMKPSPPTPKKSVNGAATKVELTRTAARPITKPSSKSLLSTMPAKSAKDANNRKVVEQKNIEIASAASAAAPAAAKLPTKQKTAERKPIGRRPKPVSPIKARMPISPIKSTRSTPTTSVKSDKDGIVRKMKGDRGTTDSSTVSTPSGIEIDSMTKLADKCLTEKSEDMSLDSIESKVLADLKEEREVVEEIEAVLQKAERIEGGRREDHLDGDDDITAEATDKKEDDMTEDDVTADIEELPKKESSRKTSHELTEEDEYLIIEKEEIYIEDSVQSGEGEDKHVADVVESQTAKVRKDTVITKEEEEEEEEEGEELEEEAEEEDEEEEGEVSEGKEKADIPEKRLGLIEEHLKETESDVISSIPNVVLEEQVQNIIASATEIVQKTEDKEDSGKKDSEDITKEPSSLSPDKFDSSEKKTTETDIKPEVDQKERQIPEKLEESHERISTLESGATTTAPTLPEDERIPLDEIKEVIDEKYLADQEKKTDSAIQVQEPSVAPIPTEPKPDAKAFEVHPPLHGIQREIVKTPDEVADLPVHEEVDPTLYRMEHFEKAKDEKPSQRPIQQREIKEPEIPPVKEQKGVFSFFGKVADKFEKGIDKLTGKSRRDSEKDIDEKSSSKSGSPKEIKSQNIGFPGDVAVDEITTAPAKESHALEAPTALEKSAPKISQIKVDAIKETDTFLKSEIEDAKITSPVTEKPKEAKDIPTVSKDKPTIELDTETERKLVEPVLETSVMKDKKYGLDKVMPELDVEEDAEDVKALLVEASKKFKTVKDSLHDSLESLEEKIAEQEMVRVELEAASKDFVKDTLYGVVEKLEDIKPYEEDETTEITELEKVKFDVPEAEDIADTKEETLPTITKDLKGAVRDVGEVLAGSAGILIEDKPKDVVEIVKKVAEVLKKDDFLSHDLLFDTDTSKVEGKSSEDESELKKIVTEKTVIPQKLEITEEMTSREEIEELLEDRRQSTKIHEDITAKTITSEDSGKSSPAKDVAIDHVAVMQICPESLEDKPLSEIQKKSDLDEPAKSDIVEADIEPIVVKEKIEKPMSDEGTTDYEIQESKIIFDRKVSPVTAEVVIVTPDLSPTSPKISADAMHIEETESAPKEVDDSHMLPTEIMDALQNESQLEKVIEDLVFTKKRKITLEIIEYITVIRKISRETVIYIIIELIAKKCVSPESVIDDPNLLQRDTVETEIREDIQDYINEKYITKNKKITMEIIRDISIEKFVTKRILIEMIIEFLIKKNIPREMILNISEIELSQLRLCEERIQEEHIEKRTSEIGGSNDSEVPEETSPTVENKCLEIKKFITDEVIGKGRRITPQLIDDVCVAKLVPRRMFVDIIEKIIIERNISRSSMFDISEKELSELLASEKEHAMFEPEAEVVDAHEPSSITSEKRLGIIKYISDEFILKKDKITLQTFKDICVRNNVSKEILLEIIEEIVANNKLLRTSVLDISENQLTELSMVDEKPISKGSEVERTDTYSDEQLRRSASGEIDSVTPNKTEIENTILEEYVLKQRRITPYIFEDICIRYGVPRRIIIQIIEEIIIKRNVQRNLILDISDNELSELLKVVEAQGEEQDVGDIQSPAKEDLTHDDVDEDKLLDGFVSISSKDEIKADTAVVPHLAESELTGPEKDVDDFEAVEQEYKIHGSPIAPETSTSLKVGSISDEKMMDDVDDIIDDHISDVVEAKEKIIESAPLHIPATTTEQEPKDICESSKIVDTTEKYLTEAQEKVVGKLFEHPSTILSDDTKPSALPLDKGTHDISDTIASQESVEYSAEDDGLKDETNIVESVAASTKMADEIIPKIGPEVDGEVVTAERKPSLFEALDDQRHEFNEKSLAAEDADISVMKGTSDVITKQQIDASVMKAREGPASKVDQSSPKDEHSSKDVSMDEQTAVSSGTVHRMVVTASSEDGGQETDVCPTESIVYTPEDSLKGSPIKTTPDQDSLRLDKESLHSGISTPEKDSISDKSAPGTKDGSKITPEDSLDKSPSGLRDSQDLEDSLAQSDLSKVKEIKEAKSHMEEVEDTMIQQSSTAITPSKLFDDANARKLPTDLSPVEIVIEKSDLKKQEGSTSILTDIEPTMPTDKVKIVADQSSKDEYASGERKPSSGLQADEAAFVHVAPTLTATDSEIEAKSPTSAPVGKVDQKPDLQQLKSTKQETGLFAKEVVIMKAVGDEPNDSRLESFRVSGEEPAEQTDKLTKSSSTLSERTQSPTKQDFTFKPSDHFDTVGTEGKHEPIDQHAYDSKDDEVIDEKNLASHDISPVVADKTPSLIASDDKSHILENDKETTVTKITDHSKPPSLIGQKGEKEEPSDRSSPTDILQEQPIEKKITGSLSPITIPIDDKHIDKIGKDMLQSTESLDTVGKKDSTSEGASPQTLRSPRGDEKEALDRPICSVAISDKPSTLELKEPVDTARSPGVISDGSEVVDSTLSSNGIQAEKEQIIHSRASSITSDKPVEKELRNASKSPSIVDGVCEEREYISRSRSSSIALDKLDEKEPISPSKSPDTKHGTELIDQTGPGIVFERHEEKKIIDQSTSLSFATAKQDAEKPSHYTASPIGSTSPSTVSEKPDGQEEMDRSRSPSIVAEKRDEKESIGSSRSPSIAGDLQDEKESKERPRSPSIAGMKQDEVKTIGDSKSPDTATEMSGEKERIDRSRSPSIATKEEDREELIGHAISPGIAVEQLKEAQQIDRSKSPSIAAEEQDKKESMKRDEIESVERAGAPIIAPIIRDEEEYIDDAKSITVAAEKSSEKQKTDRSRALSIDTEIHYDKESINGSRSPSIDAEKHDKKESIDYIKSPSTSAESLEQQEQADRSRSSSVASEIHDEKKPMDESRSPSIATKGEDEKAPIESKSYSVASEKLEEKLQTDRSRSSSIVAQEENKEKLIYRSSSPSDATKKQDETPSIEPSETPIEVIAKSDETTQIDRSRSPSIAPEKEDEKQSMQGSRSPSIAPEKEDEKQLMQGSRSPSIAPEKEEKQLIDRSRSPSIAPEKEEKQLIDRSISSSIAPEKEEKQLIDRSRSPSIAPEKEEKQLIDRSRSPSISTRKEDGKASIDLSTSSSIIADIYDEKDGIGSSRSSSITTGQRYEKELIHPTQLPSATAELSIGKEKVDTFSPTFPVAKTQDIKDSIDDSTLPVITAEQQDKKKSVDHSESRSPSFEKSGETEKTDRSRSPESESIVVKKQEVSIDHSKSSITTVEEWDARVPVERARSPSIIAEIQDKKTIGRSRSPSLAIEGEGEEELPDHSTSLSVTTEKSDVKEQLDHSRSPSTAAEMQIEKDSIDRSRSPSIVAEKHDDKEFIDRPRVLSIAAEIKAEEESADRSRSPSFTAAQDGIDEAVDHPKPLSPATGKLKEMEQVGRSRSHSITAEIEDEKPSHDRSRSPSIVGEKQFEKRSVDQSATPRVTTDKSDRKEHVDRSRSPSIAKEVQDEDEATRGSRSPRSAEKLDEKESIDHIKSLTIVTDKQDEKASTDGSRSPSITGAKRDEKESPDHSKSLITGVKKQDEMVSIDRSRSPSIAADEQAEKESSACSRSPSITDEKRVEKKSPDHSKSRTTDVEKQEEKESIDRSRSPSIAADKQAEKESPAGSRSPSITGEKQDEKKSPDHGKSLTIDVEKRDAKESIDPARSPGITADKQSEKESIDRSRSPSITADKQAEKELTTGSRSPSITGEKQDEKESPDHLKSLTMDVEKHDEKESIERSRSASVADDKHAEKESTVGSKSPSITGEKQDEKESPDYLKSLTMDVEKHDEKESIDRSRSPSIADKQVEKESIAGSRSPSITDEKRVEKKSPDYSKSLTIDVEKHDQKESIDRSRSPSIAADKQAEKVLTTGSRSPSITGEKQEERESSDHSKSLTIDAAKHDEEESIDRSRSSSIAADKQTEKESTAGFRSPSITSEKQDDKESRDLSKSLIIETAKHDEKDSLDLSRSPSIAADKQAEQELITGSRSPSITGEKQDEQESSDHSKSLTIDVAKHDEEESIDRSRSPSIADKQVEKASTVGSRSPSITDENKGEKESPDHMKSLTIDIEKRDEKKSIDPSKSPSIAAGEQTKKESTAGSRSPSITGEKQDETESPDHLKSLTIDVEKRDEKEPIDPSRSPSIAADKQAEKESTAGSRTPSITDEKQDEKESPHHSTSLATDVEKHDEKKSIDRSRSPSIAADKQAEKELTAGSRSLSITSEKRDEKESPDHSKSLTIDVKKHDQKESIARSRSPSIAADKQVEKERRPGSPNITGEKQDEKESPDRLKSLTTDAEMESIDRSRSPSIAADKEAEKGSTAGSRSPSIIGDKQDKMEASDYLKSRIIEVEKHDEQKFIDRSRSSSIAADQQAEKESTSDSRSPNITGAEQDEKETFDQSKSLTIAAGKHDQKESVDLSRSLSIEQQAEEKSTDVSRSPSICGEKQDEKKSIDSSKLRTDGGEKSDGEEQIDRSRSPSIIAGTQDKEESLDISRSPSITGDKKDEPESSDQYSLLTATIGKTDEKQLAARSQTSIISPEIQDGMELIDRSRSFSIAAEKEDKKESIERSQSPDVAVDKQDGTEIIGHSKSPSIAVKKQDEKDLTDRSRSPSIATEKQDGRESIERSRSSSVSTQKHDEKESKDGSRSPSIATDKRDETEAIDHSRSPSIVTDKQDAKELIGRSRSSSITTQKEDEKELIDGSRSPSIAAEKQDERELIERSRSSSVSTQKQDEKELIDGSRSSSIAVDKRDETEAIEHSRSPSIATEKQDEIESIDGSRSPSIAADKRDETEVIEHSRSPSIATEKQDARESIGRSRSSSVTIQKEDGKEPIDGSISFSIAADKRDGTGTIDHSRSPSIVAEKWDEGEKTVPGRSPSIAAETLDDIKLRDRSETRTIISEKPDEKDKFGEGEEIKEIESARSPSFAPESRDEEELIDDSKISSVSIDMQSKEESIDRSQSSSSSADYSKAKEEIDRLTSIVVKKQDKVESDELSKLYSVDDKKPDEIKGVSSPKSLDIAHEKQDDEESIHLSKPTSTVDEKQDEKKTIDYSKSSSTIEEKKTAEKSIDHSQASQAGSVTDTQDDEAIASSRSTSIPLEKHDEKEPVSDSSTHAEAHEIKVPIVRSGPPEASIQKEDKTEPLDHSATLREVTEKKDAIQPVDPSKSPSVSSDKEDKMEMKVVSRSPSIASEKHEEEVSQDGSRSPSHDGNKQYEPEPCASDLTMDEKIIKDKIKVEDESERTSIVHADDIVKKSSDVRKDSETTITMVPDSRLDEKDAVQALQKLAETIADKSAEMKYERELQIDETTPQEPTRERSRSHSLLNADEKSPLGRSRTASLFDDKVPETSLFSGDDGVCQDRETKYTDDKSDQASITIAKLKDYIVNTYITRKERITPYILVELETRYSISRTTILEIIEHIIVEKNMSWDSIVSFSKGDAMSIPDVLSKPDHIDMLDVSLEKQCEIETCIQSEFVTRGKKITSEVLDELAAKTRISRYTIIIIIKEMINNRKGLTVECIEDSILDESTTEPSQLGEIQKQGSEVTSVTDVESATPDDGQFKGRSLQSISPDVIDSDLIAKKEMPVSDMKHLGVEAYIVDECVKKGIKIDILVLEQIIMRMGISRSVLLNIIKNIIEVQKVPRTSIVDDTICDELDKTTQRSPEHTFREKAEHAAQELLASKDRLVEISGKSTPDPKSSGYSTPEVRQYDKFDKDMSSYSTDYESPFHKAFVGGMTEIRTTHITTLSGKSTPDYTIQSETPGSPTIDTTDVTVTTGVKHGQKESMSEKEEQEEHVKIIRTTVIEEQEPIIERKIIRKEVIDEEPQIITKIIQRSAIDQADSTTDRYGSQTISQTGQETSTIEEEEPIIERKIIRKEVIEEAPQIITRIIHRSAMDQADSTTDRYESRTISRTGQETSTIEEGEPIIERKIIRKEVIEEAPQIITRIIHRSSIDQADSTTDRTESRTTPLTGQETSTTEEEERIIERKIIRKEVIEEPPKIVTKIIHRSATDQADMTADRYESQTITLSGQDPSPELIKMITMRSIETIATQDIPHHEGTPQTSTSGSTELTRDYRSEEKADGDIRTITGTVTTVSEPADKVGIHKTVVIRDKLEETKSPEKSTVMPCTTTQIITDVTGSTPIDIRKTSPHTVTSTEPSILPVFATSPPGLQTDSDHDKAIIEKTKSQIETRAGKDSLEKTEPPVSSKIKDLISDQRSFSGRISPDIAVAKEVQLGAVKSATDIQSSPFFRDSVIGHSQLSGRSTPDKRPTSRSSTATPEGMRSNEVIRTTITTTRTMSEEGDIITTTMEITETTNEKGETIILDEKTDVKVEDRIIPSNIGKSTISSGLGAFKAPSDLPSETDVDPVSPRSDHSSLHSRAGTHVWGSGDERNIYSDDEVPGSPLSTTSQVGYSPQSTDHFDEHSFEKGPSQKTMEFSEADMSTSFYGKLPDLPPLAMKTTYSESSGVEGTGDSATDSDFSFKKFTAAKKFGDSFTDEKLDGKRYVDDADLDFEKALMERKEIKTDEGLVSAVESSAVRRSSTSQSQVEDSEQQAGPKKDPLAGWDTPLGLPSPKPPRKFNLRSVARAQNSGEIIPDSINVDPIKDWGEPLRLPSPAAVHDEASNKGAPTTPKKERKQPKKVISENLKNRKRSESPAKSEKKSKDAKSKIQPVYMDLTYVPHHGNSYYTSVEFFKRVRARYYVFSGIEPSREVYDALLDAKKTWEDKDLEVTMIPTYDTDTLGYWVADNEEALAAHHIDLSPSASRCTINLQDHETSCSAYRLEF